MMTQRQLIEEALRKLGITNEEQLNEAIRKQKPVDLTLMTARIDPDHQQKVG